MNIIFFTQLIPLLATAGAFFYGIFHFCKKGVGLYFQLLTFGIGCFMLSKIFCILCLLTIKELPQPFHVGYLGFMGCFAFLCSAHFGQLDSIIDDGGEELKSARRIGLLAPLVLLILICLILWSSLTGIDKLLLTLIYIPAILGSYYNLKHFLAPDFGFTFIKAIRPCNIAILLIYFFGIGRIYFEMTGDWYKALANSIALSLSFVALILLAERGRRQWTV